MLFWEAEYPAYGRVHHLMVLCYHLQHPSLYSPEAVRWGTQTLEDFLERGMTPQEVRRDNRATMDSGKRQFRIKGTPAAYGTYDYPVEWTMTAADVTTGGVLNYCDNVEAWARSVYEALKASGNFVPSNPL
jgi:hypothetical protein